jgi:lipopolysaccharide export system permease protein
VLILRYLTRDILQHTAAVSVVILLIVVSGQFVRLLGDVAEGDLAVGFLLSILTLSIPNYLELILPLAFLVGAMLALGRLYMDSEMVVLSSSGLGPFELAKAVSVSGLVVAACSAVLAFGMTPWSRDQALQLMADATDEQGLAAFVAGRFQRRAGGFDTVYANGIDNAQGTLLGLFLAEKPSDFENEGITITYAESGQIVRDLSTGARYLELNNGRRYHGVPGALDYRVTEFAVLGERLPDAELSEQRFGDKLLDAMPSLELFQADTPATRATLHWRFSLVWMPISLALLALGLARTDRRRGRYMMMLPAVVFYLVYLVGVSSLRTQVAEGHLSALALWALHLGVLLVSVGLIYWPLWSIQRMRPVQQ